MKGTTYTKIISAILIAFLTTIYPSIALSNSLSLTPTPTPSPELTPGIVYVQKDETNLEKINEFDESNQEEFSFPESTGSATINSSELVEIEASKSAVVDIEVKHDNAIDVERKTEIINNTGDNIANSNISLAGPIEIESGEATSSADISSVVNTNIVGTGIQPVITSVFTPLDTDLDYSYLTPCENIEPITTPHIKFNGTDNSGNNIRLLSKDELKSNVGVYNSNDANIDNTINLKSLTGRNEAIDNIGGDTHINTGSAIVNLDMFNMANTNLIGHCGFFTVTNIFTPYNHNIILPYEVPYISPKLPGAVKKTDDLELPNSGLNTDVDKTIEKNITKHVKNDNEDELETYVVTNTNTGDNEIIDSINFLRPAIINSGYAESNVNTVDITNTNVVGSEYLYLKINHYGNWAGKVQGWTGEVFENDDSLVLVDVLSPRSPKFEETKDLAYLQNTGNNVVVVDEVIKDNIVDVATENDAKIKNNINLLAETGINKAGRFNSAINTGEALIKSNVLNMVNTNIVGNNWFYGVVNIFSDFIGDIIFPRPDLTIKLASDKSVFEQGSIITFSIEYSNEGLLTAENTVVINNTPADTALVFTSDGGAFENNHIAWNLGSIQPGEKGQLSFGLIVISDDTDTLTNNAAISTTTPEPIKDNNVYTLSISKTKSAVNKPKDKTEDTKEKQINNAQDDAKADLADNENNNVPQESVINTNDNNNSQPEENILNEQPQNTNVYSEKVGLDSIKGTTSNMKKTAKKIESASDKNNVSSSKLSFSPLRIYAAAFIIYLLGFFSGIVVSKYLTLRGIK